MQKINSLFLLVFVLLSCDIDTQTSDSTTKESVDKKVEKTIWSGPNFQFTYQLDQPNETFKLPNKLAEISGLSLSNDRQFLLAVNDEKGKVYFINKKTGAVEQEKKCAKNGDFEGVESVGNYIFMVKSNGKIYQINTEKEMTKTVLETPLSLDNDIEGLGYDAQHHRLLIACKGKAGINDQKLKKQRAIYAYDLKEQKMLEEPVLLINRDTIEERLQRPKRLVDGVLKAMNADGASDSFSPSGIAQHPVTKEFYIVASVGKLLMVVHPSGEIRYIEKLDTKIHKQPEGICFDDDGTLYISTEGRGGKGKIYRFDF